MSADSLLDALAGAAGNPLILSAAAVLVAIAALAVVLYALARRGRGAESLEIVRLLEEMRSGRARSRLELDPGSPLAPIADSANRLAQDLGVRLARAETTSEGFLALQDAARGYAVVTTDVDGDVRAVSAGAVSLFGWDEDAIIGRNASLVFDEASWKDLLPKLTRRSLRERGIETHALMTRRDGTRFHGRVQVKMLHGAGDDGRGFVLVVQDVSEQVRVESDLRAAETRARLMLEDVPIAVARVEQGRLVSGNAALRRLLAVGESDPAGIVLVERIATEDVLVVSDILSRLEAATPGEALEAVVAVRGMGRTTSEERLTAISHRVDGRPGALVTFSDATEERRMLRALAASEDRAEVLLEASDDGLLFLADEPSGARVRLANGAILELLGASRSEFLGATAAELSRALRARGPGPAAMADRLDPAADVPAREVIAWDASGRWIELRVAVAGSTAAGARGRIVSARDVTAQKAIERGLTGDVERLRRRFEAAEAGTAELRAAQHDLEARRGEAERLNHELKMLDAMKSDLLANVSHELQTPLVSIRGYTEMIAKGRLGAINDEQKKGLALSLKNIDRLIAMIDNLLAFARMDREEGGMTLSSFPLDAVVEEALALLGERLEAKRLHVSRRFEERGVTILADRDKILQVFLNLLSNAVKFNRDDGSIEVAARRGKPGFALVQVRDTGVGIAKDDLEKIFDRFYQSPVGATSAAEGTGIGLAIVRNILRLHGCVIQATSAVGAGTTFSFTLPLAGSMTGKPEPGREAAPADPPAADPPAESARPAPQRRDPPPVREPDDRPRLRIIRRS